MKCYYLFVFSAATDQLKELIKQDEFLLSLKHIKSRRKLRSETLFAVDFPASHQKFVLILDRSNKKGTVPKVARSVKNVLYLPYF